MTTASGGYGSHAEGHLTVSEGVAAHAEGLVTQATGEAAHSQGSYTKASGDYSHAGGLGSSSKSYRNEASGNVAFSHQQITTSRMDAAGDNSAILGGIDNSTTATALRSVVLGSENQIATQPDMVYVPALNLESNTPPITPTDGNIIWDGVNFRGYTGFEWKNLDETGGGGGGSSLWSNNANYLFPLTLTDSVGIGTNRPRAALDVAGRIEISNTGGSVYIGQNAGAADALDEDLVNVYIGHNAGAVNEFGSENVAIGTETLFAATETEGNTAVGAFSLVTTEDGSYNTALGAYTLYESTG